MAYVKIIYQDSPSTATPLNAQNLNHMDDGIAENDRRLNELATAGVVNTFNGRRGVVVPESGDYTADMIPYDEENSVGDILGNATSEIDGITVASASGESFALVPTSEGNALATHIFGMSTQNGTPTPSSPVDIVSSKADFRCVGKNLIPYPYSRASGYSTNGMTGTYDEDGVLTINKVAGSATAYFAFFNTLLSPNAMIPLLPSVRYILSIDLQNASNTSIYVGVGNTDIAAIRNKATGFYEISFTTPSVLSDLTIALYYGKDIVETNCKIRAMIRLASVTDATYEPYKSTDITTDLTLRAIEVTSSDNYNLVRDGKYYIADTVDWSEDGGYVLTRRIKHLDVESTTNTDKMFIDSSAKFFVYRLPSDAPVSANYTFTNNWAKTKSNIFVESAISSSTESPAGKGAIIVSNNYCRIGLDSNMATTIEGVRTWLTNNPTYIEYALATPTTEPLTSEQAQSLLSLKTYDVSTSINAQASPEPTVELEYAKTQTTALALSGHNVSRINALKIADLNTALIELGGN